LNPLNIKKNQNCFFLQKFLLKDTNTPFIEDQQHNKFINPNTIFDFSEFCHSFPTILGKFSEDNLPTNQYFRQNRNGDLGDNLKKILEEEKNILQSQYSQDKINPIFDFFKKQYDSSNLRFSKDIIWNGQIRDFDGWKNIINRIGEFISNKHRFKEEGFSNTPLILTQAAIDTELLFTQNEKILEIMFEEFQCPRLLICSQALVNLLSYNQYSGTVVDLGESGTQFTTIVDGYTQYHESIYNPFLSGRNMNLLFYYEKFSKKLNYSQDQNEFSLDYLEYFEAKIEREKISNLLFYDKYLENFNTEINRNEFLMEILNWGNDNIENKENYNSNKCHEIKTEKFEQYLKNIKKSNFNCYDAFYFYPKFFRNIFNQEYNQNNCNNWYNINDTEDKSENSKAEFSKKKQIKYDFLLDGLNEKLNSKSVLNYEVLKSDLHNSISNIFIDRKNIIQNKQKNHKETVTLIFFYKINSKIFFRILLILIINLKFFI